MRLREIGAVVVWLVLAIATVGQRPVIALQEVPQPARAERENNVKQLHQAHSAARGQRGLAGSRLVVEIVIWFSKVGGWKGGRREIFHGTTATRRKSVCPGPAAGDPPAITMRDPESNSPDWRAASRDV